MADQLTLNVNGHDRVVTAAAETPLLYVLRNELRLSGPVMAAASPSAAPAPFLSMERRFAPALRLSPPPQARK